MKKKNILEFCLSPDLGGLELFVLNCYNFFKTKTNCKIVLAPDKKLDKYFENEDILYIKRKKLFPLLSAFKLAKYIDKYDIDIVHFHWAKDILIVILAKILSKKKPQIIQTRHMTMTRFKSDFYHKWLYKNINTIHAVTKQVKGQIELFIPSDICPKVKTIYIGTAIKNINKDKISTLKEKYKQNDEFIVGIVGRVQDEKGQFLVIDAIKRLKNLNIKALIVGDTMDKYYLNNLKQQIKNQNIENKIIFVGFTKDINEYMSIFDVNILATTKETFGLVIIEAMINKVCIIATNSGGPLEIIDDGVDGLLFERDSKNLAKKIKLLYDDKNYKDNLALAGYRKAKDMFDSHTQNTKLYNLIENII